MSNNFLSIAIVGKPNVGKSTIFNRFINANKSIVSEISGTTRDRISELVKKNNKEYLIFDTGGYVNNKDSIQQLINKQVEIAIDVADVIFFVLDYKQFITKEDEIIARKLRKNKKPVIVLINKFDDQKEIIEQNWKQIGFESIIFLSATHNFNLNQPFEIIEKNYEGFECAMQEKIFSFSLIGQPNAGKSTLANILLNDNRMIVSDIPGTTRDAVDAIFSYDNNRYLLIDTAGIRTKNKFLMDLEFYSLLRTKIAIKKSNCCLLVIDASTYLQNKSLEKQDLKIASLILESEKPIIIIFSKSDLISLTQQEDLRQLVKYELDFLKTENIIFSNWKEKNITIKILKFIDLISNELKIVFEPNALNEILLKAIAFNEPKIARGERIKIYSIKQTNKEGQLLTFQVICEKPFLLTEEYKKYLMNFFTNSLNIKYTPLKLFFKKR